MTRVHLLKTWPAPFAAILAGTKHHEIRVDDRGFMVGDELELYEYDPSPAGRLTPARGRTGRMVRLVVTHITPGGTWGLPADLCVMSIAPVANAEPAGAAPAPPLTVRCCTCLGSCHGRSGLAPGWACALTLGRAVPPRCRTCDGTGKEAIDCEGSLGYRPCPEGCPTP